MTTLTLSEKLLLVLTAVKKKQSLAVTESMLEIEESKCWMKVLREYFYGLPADLTEGLGLKRNERCMRAIETFEIPNEWDETEASQLSKFSFSF